MTPYHNAPRLLPEPPARRSPPRRGKDGRFIAATPKPKPKPAPSRLAYVLVAAIWLAVGYGLAETRHLTTAPPAASFTIDPCVKD